MDHYGYDTKRSNLLVTALGNDTLEVVNSWKRIKTVTGLEHPQAVLYIPDTDEVVVSGTGGKLNFYDAESYSFVKSIDFGENTDNMRYDPDQKRVYVGHGAGGLAVVDPFSRERIQDFPLGSHPESFQLESKGPRIWVNLPDQEAMAVVDRETGAVTKWKISGNTNSHTLALDEVSHRLFSCSLQPGRLTVVDSETGNVVASQPCAVGVDDIWWDAGRKRIMASGSGVVDVIRQLDPDHYELVARVPTVLGAGATSYYRRSRTAEDLYLSVPNMLPQGGSEVWIAYILD